MLGVNSSSPTEVSKLVTSSYNDLITSFLYPVIAGSAIYGFVPTNFNTYTAGNGTATTSSNFLKVSSGTSTGNYGVIRSFRSANYKEGAGLVVRIGARFPENTSTSQSGIGLINLGDEFSFGYNGTTFGIWHRYGGKAEVQTLTLTVGASGNETATLTLAGSALSISLTSGTVQHNARQIAEYIMTNSTIWEAYQQNDKVIIASLTDGDKTGTFSYSTTGTSAGSLSESTAGATKTSTHLPTSSWNGKSLTSFDASKGNTYEIHFKNGYGDVDFYISESGATGPTKVHSLLFTNKNTITNCLNPGLHAGLYATATSSTTSVSIESAYITILNSGENRKVRNPRSYSNTKNISTTPTSIFTLRTKKVFNNLYNQSEIEPVFLTLANDGTKTAIFELWTNTTLGGTYNYQSQGSTLISEIDIAGTTITGGTMLASFVVAKGTTAQIDLTNFQMRFPPSLRVSIVGYMVSGAAADLTASLVWYEDLY